MVLFHGCHSLLYQCEDWISSSGFSRMPTLRPCNLIAVNGNDTAVTVWCTTCELYAAQLGLLFFISLDFLMQLLWVRLPSVGILLLTCPQLWLSPNDTISHWPTGTWLPTRPLVNDLLWAPVMMLSQPHSRACCWFPLRTLVQRDSNSCYGASHGCVWGSGWMHDCPSLKCGSWVTRGSLPLRLL